LDLGLGVSAKCLIPEKVFHAQIEDVAQFSCLQTEGGVSKMKQQWALCDNEVIDRNLLAGLAILAKANSRSVVDELNTALSSYVMENLFLRLLLIPSR
jgi:hypothetical protein